MDLLNLYFCILVSWQVHEKRLWTQCGQCSVLEGRAGTSRQPQSCPSRPRHSPAWPAGIGAWRDKFWVRPRDTRQLWNETSIRKLLRSCQPQLHKTLISRVESCAISLGTPFITQSSVLRRKDHNKVTNLIRGVTSRVKQKDEKQVAS